MVNVFVYGTLIPGQALYSQIERFVWGYKEATLEGFDLFLAASGWYPLIKEGAGTVSGMLLSVEDEAIPVLDRIEGAPFLYERREIVTTDGDLAYVYVGNHAKPGEPIPSGDFVEYVKQERAA